jgi:hypothetical protein
VHTENQFIRRCQDLVMQELVNAGEEVLIFYNDKASFNHFLEMMRSERNRMDDTSPLCYHIELVGRLERSQFFNWQSWQFINIVCNDDIYRVAVTISVFRLANKLVY